MNTTATTLSSSFSKSLKFLLAFSVTLIVANLYYYQPILKEIGNTLFIPNSYWGLLIAIVQFGYLLGVVFLVPLGDLISKKKLILTNLSVLAASLVISYFAISPLSFFVSSFFLGLGASTIQMIIPYSANLVPEKERGAMIGTLMSGLMFGIMLSRPFASLMTEYFGWHSVFASSAVMAFILLFLLYAFLPETPTQRTQKNYFSLLCSMFGIFSEFKIIRLRGFYQASLFGVFCLYWTAAPLHLASDYKLSQSQIALFALIGISGAFIAPMAGRWADKGLTARLTSMALLISSLSFLLEPMTLGHSLIGLIVLCLSGVILDACVTTNLVCSQKKIFSLPSEKHSRANGIFIAIIFLGGGLGSFLGAWSYNYGGWLLTSLIGISFPLWPLMVHLKNKNA